MKVIVYLDRIDFSIGLVNRIDQRPDWRKADPAWGSFRVLQLQGRLRGWQQTGWWCEIVWRASVRVERMVN